MIKDDAVTQNSYEHDTAPERTFTMFFFLKNRARRLTGSF